MYIATSPASNFSMATTLDKNINLSDGAIRGSDRDADGVLAFKGIPFAAPPVGPLRWKPPTPPTPWAHVLDATQFGSTCWSFLLGLPTSTPESEDCLTLNIWTTAVRSIEKRSVMIWIHGGGFQCGSSAAPRYDGSELAKKGVVCVSFNYRLGALGFLALPELDDEGYPSGNFGLQDQIAAVRWVQNNIAAFGGDPNNITLFGESAGGHAIGLLMSSPLAKGLFHKAILQSGAFWDTENGSLPTVEEARQQGLLLVKKLGANSVSALRSLPAKTIAEAAQWNPLTDPRVTAFAPNIDGYVLPCVPAKAFLEGRQMKIPIIAGWNSVEEYFFKAAALPHSSPAEFKSAGSLLFGSRTEEFLSFYPADTNELATTSSDLLIGDLRISQQTWEAADLHSRHGESPAYVYYLTYTSPYSPVAAHGADLAFVFGTLARNEIVDSAPPAGDKDRLFSDQVMAYWINFANNSDPNDPNASLPLWPAYSGGGADVQELGQTIAPVNFTRARFEFLQSLRADGVLPTNWLETNISFGSENGGASVVDNTILSG